MGRKRWAVKTEIPSFRSNAASVKFPDLSKITGPAPFTAHVLYHKKHEMTLIPHFYVDFYDFFIIFLTSPPTHHPLDVISLWKH